MTLSQKYATLSHENPLFSESFLAMLHHLIWHQCQYGKNLQRLLDPTQGFRAHYNEQLVLLENYLELEPTADNKMYGACWPLTLMLAQYLKKDPDVSKHYAMGYAKGHCPPYFLDHTSSHNYLLIWPRVLEAQVRPLFQNNNGQIPKGCIFVCPSFKVIGSYQNPEGYRFEMVESYFDELPEITTQRYTSLKGLAFSAESKQTPIIPLGYVHDLLPLAEIPPHFLADTLISILFVKTNAAPIVELAYQQAANPIFLHWKNWRNCVKPSYPLGQWIQVIETNFSNPSKDTFLFDEFNASRDPDCFPHVLIPK